MLKCSSTTFEYTSQGSYEIVFESDRDGNIDIYKMDIRDQSLVRLTNSNFSSGDPAFSPDGKQIAFVSNRDGEFDLFIMNSDGTDPANPTNDEAIYAHPSWSPDGNKIVVQRFPAQGEFADLGTVGGWNVYLFDLMDDSLAPLTQNQDPVISPAWSPNRSTISVSWSENGVYNIYLIDSDGENRVKITDTTTSTSQSSWASDGTALSVTSRIDGGSDIYIVGLDNLEMRRVTNITGGRFGSSSWSPDRTKLVFTGLLNDSFDIYIANIDGTGMMNLTNFDANYDSISWNPSENDVETPIKYRTWATIKSDHNSD